MNKIINITTIYRDVYLKDDFHISHKVMEAKQPRVFVKIEDDEGNFGLGEAAALPFFNGEEAISIKTIIDEILSPELIGMEVGRMTAAIKRMNKRLPGNYTAKTAIEIALWDLAGKSTNLPVYCLLGGKYRDKIEMAYVLSLKKIPEMIEEARSAVSRGYKTIKTKLTGDVIEDEKIISGIRNAVGGQISLRADANSIYSLKDALYAAHRFEQYRLQYLEQPCSKNNPDNLKQVRDNTTTPIAADESVLSISDGYDLIKKKVIDHLVIKLIKVGGIFAGLRIASIAEISGIKCTIVSPIETSIGVAAGINLAAAAPAASVAHELNTSDYLLKDLAGGLKFDGDMCIIGDKPGLGIELKENIFI